jgi:hypothetical protein
MTRTSFPSWLILIFVWIVVAPLSGSESPQVTSAFQRVLLFSGPSNTYRQVGILNPGLPVNLIARNGAGTWLQIQRLNNDLEVAQEGWALAGFLNRDVPLDFGALPITELADADPSTIDSQSMAALYAVPVIPTIYPSLGDVIERGRRNGHEPGVITKVGDSLSASEQYLTIFSNPEYVLGPYQYLTSTLSFFRTSTAIPSVASRIGLSSIAIFDPFWADKEQCQTGESPLDCELRIKRPMISFIMFGPNDVRSMTEDVYRTQMTQIVETMLEAGTIPVLTTFSTDPAEEFFWQSINFNLQLVALAEAYQIPLINLWAAARILPDYGLDVDRIHLKHSGFNYLKFDTGHEAFYGISLYNLLSLVTLNEITDSLGLMDVN